MEKNPKSPKTAVIVLNWNNKKDTSICLRSLEKLQEVEVVLVDNGSTDDSVGYFQENFPNCTLLQTDYNLGYAGGNNVGISYALKQGFDYILILNNDTTVAPDILSHFLATFEKHPNAGILGGKIYLMDRPDFFDHFGGFWKKRKVDFEYVGFHQREDHTSFETTQPLDYICGASMMVRREVFEAIGLLDPRFFLFCEETDFCFRARKAGFDVLFCPQAKIWHKGSASFTGGKPQATYFQWRNRLLWIEKNFTGWERAYYFATLFGKHLPFFYSLKSLRSLQILLQKMAKRDVSRNRERIQRYNAALCGIHDYLLRRFGPGRCHLFLRR